MKKIIMSFLFVLLVLLAACQPAEEIVDNGYGEKTVGFVKSDLAREEAVPKVRQNLPSQKVKTVIQ